MTASDVPRRPAPSPARAVPRALALALALGLPARAPAQAPAAARDTAARDTTARRLPVTRVIGSVLPAVAPGVGSGVPARAAVVDGRAIAAGRPRVLADALAGQPGASLYDDVGSAYKPTLVVRGFTVSPVVGLPQGVSVFVDGVPVNEPDAGQVNFDLLPLAHVERVEVLSGTASLLGPNSLGGAINLVTRRGGGAPAGEVELSSGSWGRRALEGSVGGGARGWSYYAGGGHERDAGWRQHTDARLGNAFVNVDRLGERAGVALQAYAARSRARTAGSLPQPVYAARADSNLSAGDFEDLDQLHVALAGYAPLAGGRASLTAYVRRHDAERLNVNQVNDPDVRGVSRSRTLGAAADWRATRPLGPGALGLRVAAGAQASRTRIRLVAERVGSGVTTDVASPIRKLDASALADYRVGPLTVSGGARADVVRVPFRNRLRPERDTTSTFRRLSPRGGARLAVARGASLYASVGRSFRAPAVIELACADPEEPCPLPFALGDDPPLAPVVATTYEAGGAWARGRLLLDASAFRTSVRDDVFLFPYREEARPEGSTIDGYFANIARTRRAGVELASRLLLPGERLLHATYAHTRATFQTDAEIFSVREAAGETNEVGPGSRLPLVPAHTATLGAVARLPGGVEAGVGARYTGARWLRGDEANDTDPLPAYWTADVRVAYALGAWTAEGAVDNALDRRFATFGTFNVDQGAGGRLERFLTPGRPRSVQLTLRRSFGARE